MHHASRFCPPGLGARILAAARVISVDLSVRRNGGSEKDVPASSANALVFLHKMSVKEPSQNCNTIRLAL
jgi:hypothetical protein